LLAVAALFVMKPASAELTKDFEYTGPTIPQKDSESTYLAITNVNIFDGVNTELVPGNVLIRNNLIETVTTSNLSIPEGAEVIDGQGKTLTPGLMDAHVHLSHIEANPLYGFNERDWDFQGSVAGKEAELMLRRGFTTVRDTGGAVNGLRKAIDAGRSVGPRILASGAYISMTSGHGDLTGINEPNPTLTGNVPWIEFLGHAYVVDGVADIRAAVRQNMRLGSSQIKMMADGGISSHYDPLGVNQFSPEELRAGVEEAERWGTYVLVHAFTDEAVKHAINAGVKVIDHGPFMTEETFRLLKEKDVWFSTQFRAGASNPEEFGLVGPSVAKYEELKRNVPAMIAAMKTEGIQPAFGSDFFGSSEKAALQSEEFDARLNAGFTSPEVMVQATSHTAKMFELAGERHPYREGPIGVIEEGAYADMLIVDGNPLEDASIMSNYEQTLKLIVKNGDIYKNTLYVESEVACTMDYNPVCGLDLVTYSNLCAMESLGVKFSYHGKCTYQGKTQGSVLFTNVNVFDGTSETLQDDMNVLVQGNLIKTISSEAIEVDRNTPVIDGAGRTLTPGVIDAHAHMAFVESNPIGGMNDKPWDYQGAVMGHDAKLMLLRGFTTVRDACAKSSGLKLAIDLNRAEGPRILPSEACISMTSGHADFSSYNEPNSGLTGHVPLQAKLGHAYVVDGKDRVLSAVRQNFRKGASQIKMMADGGISSHYDPLGVIQFSPEELRAGVEEAERWGTYVLVHAFTDDAIRQAIEAGVKVIDHGPLMTEETVKLLQENDVWLSTQFRAGASSPDEFGLVGPSREKYIELQRNVPIMIAALHKYGIQPAFGSDFFGTIEKAALQSEEFIARLDAGYSSPEVMIQATSHTAKMLELAGERHPYQEGSLGVIEEGAYADILLVDGNPLEDASLMGQYEGKIILIMKDGRVYKNAF